MSDKPRTAREFWIRQGTNGFTYEYDVSVDSLDTIKSLSRGDQVYDAVVTEPIEGGIHTIEFSAYAALLVRCEKAESLVRFIVPYVELQPPLDPEEEHLVTKWLEAAKSLEGK